MKKKDVKVALKKTPAKKAVAKKAAVKKVVVKKTPTKKVAASNYGTFEKYVKGLIGTHVLVRSFGAGVFIGKLCIMDQDCVVLDDCRRIHYWDNHTAAACTDLGLYGISKNKHSGENSRVCSKTQQHYISQVVEVIPATKEAVKNLYSQPVWTESKKD